jgi:hypothetical protein
MRIVLAVPCLLLLASVVHAQAPFPGAVNISGGWVPCDHPLAVAAGLGCETQTPKAPRSSCPKVIESYYVLLTCAERPPLPINPWTKGTFTFEVGTLYESPYPSDERLLVISVALDIDSLRRIVTGRRLRAGVPIGQPVVFYEDQQSGWVPLRPGQSQ